MKASVIPSIAVCAVLAATSAASAQPRTDIPPRPGETALEFAQRIDACNGAPVLDAEFNENRTRLSVQCPEGTVVGGTEGMSGTLGGAAAVAGGIVMAVFALGGGSSTGTTTGTTGTN